MQVEGFKMPAEWEKHSATWIAWPHEESDWPFKFAAIDWVYSEIVRTLSAGEIVKIICQSKAQKEQVAEILRLSGVNKERFQLSILPNDRSWLRDSAPTAVFDSGNQLNWIKWVFNGWAKYENHLQDRNVPDFIGNSTGIHVVPAIIENSSRGFVLEGGAFDVDGQGTIMVTEECLQSTVQERNPGLSKNDYEKLFLKYLGATKTIWLKDGCAGDDTHGHVDDIARFVAPGKVILAFEEDPQDTNHQGSIDNLKILESSLDASGRRLEVIKLPYPRAIFFDGQRLPASYANFYIGNKVVIVPTFNDPNDTKALQILSDCFPERQITGINCSDLILGLGTLHCLTQQEPSQL